GRLHDPGEIGHHAEQNDRIERDARKELGDTDADPRARRQGGREDSAGHAADGRQGGRYELPKAEQKWDMLRSFEQAASLGIAGAEDAATGHEAAKRDTEAAEQSEDDRMLLQPPP